MHVLNTNASYNIVDFITAGYGDIIDQNIGEIPSHLFDDNFFTTVESCAMNCDERQCRLCFDMMDKIKEVNGGPKQPDIFMKSYRRLRHFIRTTLDGAE